MRRVSVTVTIFCLCVYSLVLWGPRTSSATDDFRLSQGQVLYVPVYSNVLIGDRPQAFELASTLSIRNTDIEQPIKIIFADYYDTEGKRIKKFLDEPLTIEPLSTKYFFIEEKDTSGGLGANFIIEWAAAQMVNEPIIECVMIGTRLGLGISLVSPGKVIRGKSE